MSLAMAHKVIVPQKKNYVPQFLKQRDINSYCAASTRAGKAGQKSLVPARRPRKTKSPPPASSPATPARRRRPRRPADAPGCTPPPTRRPRRRRRGANAGGSVSTSPPNQRPQTLEPFFLHSLAGFLNAQRRRPRAATPAENAGRPPTSRTASCPLAATKKLEGPMWRTASLRSAPHQQTPDPVYSVVDKLVHCDPNMYS